MTELRSCGTSGSKLKQWLMANQHKQQTKAAVIDVAIPTDTSVRKNEHEKLEK